MRIIEINEEKLNQIVKRVIKEQMSQPSQDKSVQDFYNFLVSSGFEKNEDNTFKFSEYLPGRDALIKIMNVNGAEKVEVIDTKSNTALYKFNSLVDAKRGLTKIMSAHN